MRSYVNFSDHDFEFFVADLFGEIDGVNYEVFVRGADQGVDLRHVPKGGGDPDVIQCKLYLGSGVNHLISAAKREAKSLRENEIKTSRYRLVTTLELSRKKKDEILEILSGYLSSPEDIVAGGDLELRLNENEKVERRHPKLWLSSTAQLESVLNNDVLQRSRQLLEETQALLPRYVETKTFETARERLRSDRVLIIAGAPGIGKTTLARMLLFDAAREGFDPIEVSADMEEANKNYRLEERQAFYYDDFLGTNFLQLPLLKNEDKRIAQLARRVEGSANKFFLMTTREHILRQALDLSEEFKRDDFDAKRYLLELEEYSLLDRARIFFNHISASRQLDRTAKDSLLADRGYMQVLEHRNYNPRLIEYITGLGPHRLEEGELSIYLQFAVEVLNKPKRIWEPAFENQLSDEQRAMLISLCSLQAHVPKDDLQTAFRGLCGAARIEVRGRVFQKSLKVLLHSFITDERSGEEAVYLPLNPSIADFVAEWLSQAPEDAVAAIKGATFFTQLSWIERTVVAKLDGEARDFLLAELGPELMRLLDSEATRSTPVSISDKPVYLTRWAGHPAARLTVINHMLDDYELLRSELEEWFVAELEARTETWVKEAGVRRQGAVVSMAVALRDSGRLSESVLERAKALVLAEPDGVHEWSDLARLREEFPDLIELREWVEAQNDFHRFADAQIEDAAISFDAAYEVTELEQVADRIGVDLEEEWDLEAVREEIEEEEQKAEREAEAEADEPGTDAITPEGDESQQVAAVFELLAQSEED